MTKERFEKTPWHRLLQVIFIGSFLIAIGLTVGVFIANKPQKYINNDLSSITCISGEYKDNTYPLSKNRLYVNSWSDDLDSSGKIEAKKLCAYNKINIAFDTRYPDPILNNYRLNKVYETISSWEQAFGYSVLYAGGVILVFWFVKRLIFFISFGESIFRKPKKLFD